MSQRRSAPIAVVSVALMIFIGRDVVAVAQLLLIGAGPSSVYAQATAWGTITGTLSSQTDLQTALNGKQVSGTYASGTGSASGTNTGDQTITLTGNVTGSGTGSFAATVANDAVTYAKMQNVSATDRVLGRSTAGAGDVEEITMTAAGRALVDDADAAAQRVTLGVGYVLNAQALTSSPGDGATIYFGQLPKAPTTTQGISRIYIRKAGTIKVANIFSFSGTAGSNESWTCNIRLNNTGDTAIATVSASAGERVWTNSALSLAVTTSDYIEIKCVNPTWATNPATTIFGGYVYVE